MKQLTMLIAMNTDGGDRITFYYDVIDDSNGVVLEAQKKEHFFVLDEGLRTDIKLVREYIRSRFSDPLSLLTSFMIVNVDSTDRIGLTFDKINSNGQIISTNNKDGFVVLDEKLRSNINSIRSWIKVHKLSD